MLNIIYNISILSCSLLHDISDLLLLIFSMSFWGFPFSSSNHHILHSFSSHHSINLYIYRRFIATCLSYWVSWANTCAWKRVCRCNLIFTWIICWDLNHLIMRTKWCMTRWLVLIILMCSMKQWHPMVILHCCPLIQWLILLYLPPVSNPPRLPVLISFLIGFKFLHPAHLFQCLLLATPSSPSTNQLQFSIANTILAMNLMANRSYST